MALATTTLTTARAVFQNGVMKRAGFASNDPRTDYAIKMAGDEFVRRTRCTRTSDDSLSLTVGSAELDYSGVSDFHPTRLLRPELLYPGGSAWQTATSYTALDLATSGGKMYIARSDHTSAAATEPGTGADWEGAWSQVFTDVAYRLRRKDYNHVLGTLRAASATDFNGGYDYDRSVLAGGDGCRYIGFRAAADTALMSFVPQTAWRVRLTYWQPFTSWTIGTAAPDDVTLNIPDDMIYGVLFHGAPAYYERGNEQATFVREAREQFERHIARCAGQVGGETAIEADELAYL